MAQALTRVLFMGGTVRGRRSFELLLERQLHLVGAVVMREDDHEQPKQSEAVERLAVEHSIPTWTTKRLTPGHLETIESLEADLIVVVGWRTLLPAEIYAGRRLGCVGVHDSPLPRYRGFAPTNWAILNGERQWGVTLMHIADGVDEGDVVGQETFAVPDRATAADLYKLSTDATLRVLDDNLGGLLDGTAPRTPQDHSQATYACARTPDDGVIDWTATTDEIDRLVRSLCHPYPGARTTWKGLPLIVWSAEPVFYPPLYEGRIPGRVVGFTERTTDVLTADGVLRLTAVQLPGKDRQPAGAVIRSVKASLGR